MWAAVMPTLELASITTGALIILGTPLAWWMARNKGLIADVVSTIVALPIVLPPTTLGFYLLIALGPNGPFGHVLPLFGLRTLAFSFTGLVIGSVTYSLPFMVQPACNAFRAIGDGPLEAASMLRASPRDAFFSVALPLAQGGILAGGILSFAHTVGEFGVVLMIGGDIPGKTEVLSIVLFNFVETLQWHAAYMLSGCMLLFAFSVILAVTLVEKRSRLRFT